MSNIRLPEATLISANTIVKNVNNGILAKKSYSKLFDNEYYYFPDCNAFSCQENYPWHCLTSSMGISSISKAKAFYCVTKSMSKWDTQKFEKINNPTYELGVRPVFRYSEIKTYCQVIKEIEPGYLIVTFGEYPNEVVYDSNIKDIYTDSYFWNNPEPILTGNKYTLVIFKDEESETREFPEVTFTGIDGRYVIKDDEIYKVEPVYFLVDVKKDFAISRDILFCLPTLKDAREITSYKATLPYEFLNTYFVPELMQSITKQEKQEIKSEENPLIKERIDNILSLITDTCIEPIVKEELQGLIDEYNNDLESEKEAKEDIGLTLTIPKTPDTKFLEKLDGLYSKIKCFLYYNESKLIFSCLHLEKKLEIESALYKDIFTIFNYILPTLPDNKRKKYEEEINAILNYALALIIKLYQTESSEKVNIELEVRKRLQPLLEELSKDVATNYIDINLNEIIKGIFKASNDKYQANLFELINSIVREIEILIESNKLEGYQNRLIELLNNDSPKSFDYLTKLYIALISLKNEIEEKLNTNESIERKKIRRKFI